MPMLGKCLEDGHGSSNSESWCFSQPYIISRLYTDVKYCQYIFTSQDYMNIYRNECMKILPYPSMSNNKSINGFICRT
jgi:hypothetical protein